MGLLTFGLRFTMRGTCAQKMKTLLCQDHWSMVGESAPNDEALWQMDTSLWNQYRISHKHVNVCISNLSFLVKLRMKPVGCFSLDFPAPPPNSSRCYAWEIWLGVIGLPGGSTCLATQTSEFLVNICVVMFCDLIAVHRVPFPLLV